MVACSGLACVPAGCFWLVKYVCNLFLQVLRYSLSVGTIHGPKDVLISPLAESLGHEAVAPHKEVIKVFVIQSQVQILMLKPTFA